MASFDLTRRIETGMPVYPGDPPVALDAHAEHAADGYRVTDVRMGSHTGTHVDAPSHTEPDGRNLDDYPVSAFRFDAVRVDLRGKEPREPIRAAELPSPDAGTVVLQTGWDAHWGTERVVDHPYLTPAAARHLADGGYHVGTDAMNVDPTPGPGTEAAGVPAHHALLGAGRLVVENLTGLDALPERFTLLAHPVRLADADGAPVRAVAVTD